MSTAVTTELARRMGVALALGACLLLSSGAGQAQERVDRWQQTFTIRVVSNDCSGADKSVRACAPDGWMITEWKRSVKSENGANDISFTPAQPSDKPQCVRITAVVKPNPEDRRCIKILADQRCDCQKRTWLEVDITLVADRRPR